LVHDVGIFGICLYMLLLQVEYRLTIGYWYSLVTGCWHILVQVYSGIFHSDSVAVVSSIIWHLYFKAVG
jgi:hypothetical protein